MDILTHLLAGTIVYQKTGDKQKSTLALALLASVLPDIGEVLIQRKLSQKYSELFFVYDSRTSDIMVANDLSATLIYDLTHSIVLSVIILLLYFFFKRNWILVFSVSHLSHVLLDSFTHGNVWPLKLFFPFSNQRYPILSESIGNWWDWQPKFSLGILELPMQCILIWFILILAVIINSRTSKQKTFIPG